MCSCDIRNVWLTHFLFSLLASKCKVLLVYSFPLQYNTFVALVAPLTVWTMSILPLILFKIRDVSSINYIKIN